MYSIVPRGVLIFKPYPEKSWGPGYSTVPEGGPYFVDPVGILILTVPGRIAVRKGLNSTVHGGISTH